MVICQQIFSILALAISLLKFLLSSDSKSSIFRRVPANGVALYCLIRGPSLIINAMFMGTPSIPSAFQQPAAPAESGNPAPRKIRMFEVIRRFSNASGT
jgi:hypothetical protein